MIFLNKISTFIKLGCFTIIVKIIIIFGSIIY